MFKDLATVLSVGKQTPWGSMFNPFGGASFILNQQVVATLLFQLPSDAREDEIAISASGRLDVGVSDASNSIMFTWRFKGDRTSYIFDTPFHIGLEVEGARQLPVVDNSIPLVVVTQDYAGICMHMRFGTIGPRVTAHLVQALRRQISDIERPDFEERHWSAVDAWNKKFANPAAGHREALFKERVL